MTPSDSTRGIDVMVPRSIRSAPRPVKLRSSSPACARRRRALGAEHESLDGGDVIAHRRARGLGIVPADRAQDAPMVLVRAGGPARRVERLLAALGEQVHDRVSDAGDGAVVGGGADGRVELDVPREAGAAGGDLLALLLENALHLLYLFRRRP